MVILLGVSIVMIYSLSVYATLSFNYSSTHFVQRQILSAIFSILLMWIIAHCDIDKFSSWFGWFLLVGSFACIVIMHFLPESLASSAGGAKRWIRLGGISLAPLEFFKIGFVFFLAWSFARKFSHERSLTLADELKRFLPYIVVFAICAVLIVVLQNDFGQVFLLALTMCVMLIYSGGSFKTVAILALIALLVGGLIIALSPHRILRVMTWWSAAQDFILSIFPSRFADFFRVEDYPEPYQIYHAGNAIWNGKILGQGLGDGIIKLGFLSEAHTDMILAGLAEETGFLGVLFFIIVFVFGILHPILQIANRTQNQAYSLFCVGVACLLCFSFFINAFGVTGVIPVKGIAVPFLSYGGSSMMANCIALGLVLGIARKIP